MNLLKASKLIYIGVLALTTSCQTPTIYHAYQPVHRTGWKQHDTLFYTPMLTAGQYEIEVALRHHEEYPYQNLWLEIVYLQTDSIQLRKDSVAFVLTNEEGKWNGSGVSSLYQLAHPDQLQIEVTAGDTIKQICITHIMRNATLQGITDIGLRINKLE
ncbi:MAG: gliding motility lipoprotein GldH [Phocaeicola sp.]